MRMTCVARSVSFRDDVRASDLRVGEIIEVMYEILFIWWLV